MDGRHFDDLARHLSSRRTALGAMLAGLLLPTEAAARGKNKKKHKAKQRDKDKGKDKSRGQKRATAQVEPCWRSGACIPKKGANVSRCDLEDYSPTATLDCTGCNASRANLRGANLQGANFTRANLSGACLTDANFFGATFANTTNLANAIFCRTTMPDGWVNNSGCEAGTACCPTCLEDGLACGPGIGGACCGASSLCINGVCQCPAATCESLQKTCGEWPDGCGRMLQCGPCAAAETCQTSTCSNGTCAVGSIDGQQAPGCTDTGNLCCGGTCVDTTSNFDFCGSCDNACFDPFSECQNGACVCLPTAQDCGFLCLPLCSNNPTFWQDRFQFCFETDATRQGDCAACTSWTGCFGSLATGVAACGAVNGTCFG